MAVTLFYLSTLSFFLGIFWRSLVDMPVQRLVAMMLLSFFFAVWWRWGRNQTALYVSVALLVFVLGIIRFEMQTWFDPVIAPTVLEQEVLIEGVVAREPDRRERTTHIFVRTDEHVGVLLYADRSSTAAYGDRIIATGTLTIPESFETDLGRTFNYPEYLKSQGVSVVMFYPEIHVVESGQGYWLLQYLFNGKQMFMNTLESVIPEPQVGLAEGLLLGVKSALGDELEMVFRRTGIIHIVVLSGYNVMLVVIFVMTILSAMLRPTMRLPFGLVAIALFAILVGLSATVVRASLMAALILIAKATGRSYAVIRALVAVAVLMLIINPRLLTFDPGFQLSFVATLGLILLAPHLTSMFTQVPTVFGVREFLVATIATQIFVLPLLLYQIGEFSVVSVVVNVLVLPMVPVAMLLTFITGILGLVSSTIAVPIGYVAHLSLSYILVVASWFASLPFASYVVPPFSFGVMMLTYALLGVTMWKLFQHDTRKQAEQAISLDGWTIEDAIEAKEMAELSKDNSATTPSFFR